MDRIDPRERASKLAERNLLEELFALRDRQRETRGNGLWHVHGEGLPWELNRHGFMRWYMHPLLDDVCINSVMLYTQRIPSGSRSGKQTTPGETVMYVLEGRGHSLINDVRYNWEAGDCINLPVLKKGVTFQHFNGDPQREALLVAGEPNYSDPVGVDRGAVFEQVDNCPEYEAQHPAGLPRVRGGAPTDGQGALEVERMREPEPDDDQHYEIALKLEADRYQRSQTGKILIKASDRHWASSRQGRNLNFLNTWGTLDAANSNWTFFLREQTAHSGKHRHQGGAAIFVVEGEGFSVVEGEKIEWSKHDLLLLPIKAGGVEHQHFSRDPSKTTRWLAFLYKPFMHAGASVMEHVEGVAARAGSA